MDTLLSTPAIVKTFAVFAAIVFVNSRGLHLGLSALIGAVLIGLWSGIAPLPLAARLALAAVEPDTLFLSVLLSGILFLSSLMRTTGRVDGMVSAYRSVVRSPRIAAATLPTVIGVLPVPGGAVFSAPMVSAIDERNELDPLARATANYWFRHLIEHVWPLYPAFILTTAVTGLSIPALIAVNAYAPVFLFVVGLLLLLPASFGRIPDAGRKGLARSLADLVSAFAPILTVIACAVALEALWPILGAPVSDGLPKSVSAALRRYVPAFIGVVAALSSIKFSRPELSLRAAFPARNVLAMVGTVAGIRVFASVLSSLGVASAAGGELAAFGVPTTAVVALLPLITALVTGVGFGYVGLALPLVVAALPPDLSPVSYAAHVALAGAFGFAGMMLSPLHVCMVVSAEHFGIKASDIIRRVAAPIALFCAFALGYFFLLSRW
jgi:hypothetical protein